MTHRCPTSHACVELHYKRPRRSASHLATLWDGRTDVPQSNGFEVCARQAAQQQPRTRSTDHCYRPQTQQLQREVLSRYCLQRLVITRYSVPLSSSQDRQKAPRPTVAVNLALWLLLGPELASMSALLLPTVGGTGRETRVTFAADLLLTVVLRRQQRQGGLDNASTKTKHLKKIGEMH